MLLQVVLAGGLEVDLDSSPEVQLCDSVHGLSPATMTWYSLPRLAIARAEAATCSLADGGLFVAGGISKLNDNALANPGHFVDQDMSMRGQPGQSLTDSSCPLQFALLAFTAPVSTTTDVSTISPLLLLFLLVCCVYTIFHSKLLLSVCSLGVFHRSGAR